MSRFVMDFIISVLSSIIESIVLYILSILYKKIKNHHTSGQSNSDCNVTYINNGDINIHINK